MAQAAKLNKDEADRGVNAFSLAEPMGKLAAYPRRLRSFLHDVRVEMRQVNWPSRADVISTTIVVTITVAFFGVYFFMTDSLLGKAIGLLINYAKRH
ncbi:MAG: preprotein translocase subunit SecE [Candidatus Acidiferrales bacterium]